MNRSIKQESWQEGKTVLINKKKREKRTCDSVNFSVPDDQKAKMKGSKKINKYLDLVRDLKKLSKVKMTQNEVGALGTVLKGLEKKDQRNRKSELESRPSRFQHCYNQVEFSEESWKPEETCCHIDSNERELVKGEKHTRIK